MSPRFRESPCLTGIGNGRGHLTLSSGHYVSPDTHKHICTYTHIGRQEDMQTDRQADSKVSRARATTQGLFFHGSWVRFPALT